MNISIIASTQDLNYLIIRIKVCFFKLTSDMKGLVDLPRVRGRGQDGKGQGQDFLALTQTPTVDKGWGFCEGKSRVVNRYILTHSPS